MKIKSILFPILFCFFSIIFIYNEDELSSQDKYLKKLNKEMSVGRDCFIEDNISTSDEPGNLKEILMCLKDSEKYRTEVIKYRKNTITSVEYRCKSKDGRIGYRIARNEQSDEDMDENENFSGSVGWID